MFFPRGGSAQVVRYLAREIARDGRFRPRVVAGSVGPAGGPGDARDFFAGLDLVTVDYDAALGAPDPLAASPPMHPSYEDRPGAPDRVMAALDDAAAEHLVARVAADPGRPRGAGRRRGGPPPPPDPGPRGARRPAARPAGDDPPPRHRAADARGHRGRRALGARPAWADRMRRWAARSTRVLVGSEPARVEATAALGLPADAVEVVPNGVDLRLFDGRRASAEERAATWRRRLLRRAARLVARRTRARERSPTRRRRSPP